MAERAHPFFRTTVRVALGLAFVVVVLGAFVRLSDAGLGCPDWPGCYGHMVSVPVTQAEVEQANALFPDRPVDAAKATREMVHRYFAGGLGLLTLALAVTALCARHRARLPLKTSLALLLLVIFQALLGMWTVTLQLKPVIVMAHLLGGFATLSLLWWLFLGGVRWAQPNAGANRYRAAALLGVMVLVGQIALGGWTSANYAALACPDFPTCQSQWWPPMDFEEGFVLWRGLGLNYEFGVLDNPARTAIHVTHRIGALVTTVYLLALGSTLFFRAHGALCAASAAVIVLTVLQVSLGISNVVLGLPLSIAAAHNAVAALLLLAMLSLVYMLRPAAAAITAAPARGASAAQATRVDHVLT
ncbi:MAG: COX15/CtaA family protein [Gammaproteobacteria bacterium]